MSADRKEQKKSSRTHIRCFRICYFRGGDKLMLIVHQIANKPCRSVNRLNLLSESLANKSIVSNELYDVIGRS